MALGLLAFLLGCLILYALIKSYNSEQLSHTSTRPHSASLPLLPEWKAIIQTHVPVVAKMPRNRRAELYCLTMRFLTEKAFVGRNGLQIDDTIAVTIASQACLLLLGREHAFYPTLEEIHVYPSAFSQAGYDDLLVGASYASGPVVLSWDYSCLGLVHPYDGHNVVLHEFAHQLDQETGLYNGTPIFEDYERYALWQSAMKTGFRRLRQLIAVKQETVINPYGASGLEEYFAVCTEAFFEVPKALRGAYPRVYEQLCDYYRLNPVDWI